MKFPSQSDMTLFVIAPHHLMLLMSINGIK